MKSRSQRLTDMLDERAHYRPKFSQLVVELADELDGVRLPASAAAIMNAIQDMIDRADEEMGG